MKETVKEAVQERVDEMVKESLGHLSFGAASCLHRTAVIMQCCTGRAELGTVTGRLCNTGLQYDSTRDKKGTLTNF